MNQYFLLIACLQLWPLITPVNPASTWGPLILIFAVSATKEGWDDYNRYLSDKKANEKEVQAQDIRVGNIVWLRENDEVPCDLVLIGTSDPQGLCYVETSALDGETDLKTRVIPSACVGIDFELLHKIKASFSIRNETKLGMSRGIPEPKLTAMDAMIDKLTGAIFIFQIVVVIVLGIAGNVWKDTEARKLWYVQYPNESPWYEWVVIPLRFELLCSIMIPISIKVSLDLVKSLYAKFIDWDNEMIDLETGTPAHAANTAISEDLGQVEYIMTDKTGTLTENKMIFRRCHINGIFYGNESGDALKAHGFVGFPSVMPQSEVFFFAIVVVVDKISFNCKTCLSLVKHVNSLEFNLFHLMYTDAELINAVGSGSPDVVRFLTVMAICNTVIPMQSKSESISYKAQSQDEEALVRAASCLNMVFFNKNANILEINFNRAILQYDVLDTLEFTSDRKRMSVVVKDCKSGKIILLSKGADEAILPYARAGQQTRTSADAVEQYAQMGLRTLCLAWRELEEDEYREWSSLFKEANSTLVDREWRVAEVCQRLEHDFEILGIAAIEDQPKGQLLLINGKTEDEVSRSLERVLLTMRITTSEAKDVAFVIDGWALEIALKDYKKAFTELAILSRTAICCRVTPSQKAQVLSISSRMGYSL
ncbi:hypothetical protein TEA_028599 [Camellia sinensis var. sinensis]|uniref:P-type ATPase A domain-containing protein n=1 Tax=Camellia sinensis var. sinensis TaxID=542762 RepID=A0A4S4ESZ6_CAMSN|nr:hypothetical protein TEA_028599 [Camellia sinensis var. sinensis]